MVVAQLKSIAKHMSIYGMSRILSRAVGFLMIPVYTKFLTPTDYGTMEIIDLTLTVVGLVIASGINNSIFKFYHKYQDKKDRDQVVSTAILTVALMGLIVELAGFAALGPIARLLFGSSDFEKYLAMAFVTFYCNLLSDIPLGYLRAQQKSAFYASVSLGRLAFELSLNIYLVAFKGMGLAGVMTTQLISSIGVAFLLQWVTLSGVGFGVSLKKSSELLRFGLPLIPSAVGIFIVNNGDKFFLKHYSGLEAVGIYALAFKFGYMLSYLVTQPFILVWDGKMYEIGHRPDAQVLFGKIFTWVAFTLCFVGLGMSLCAGDLIRLMAHGNFWSASGIVPVIVLAYIFHAFYHYFQVGLYIKSRTKLLGSIIFSSGLVTLGLFWLLIRPFGAMGAAAATATSFLIMAVAVHVASQRIYPVKYEYRRIAQLLLTGACLYAAGRIAGGGGAFHQVAVNFLAWALYPVLLYFTGFMEKDERLAAAALIGRLREGKAGEVRAEG